LQDVGWQQPDFRKKKKNSNTDLAVRQGGVISPLLANVFLRYVLDQRVVRWRAKTARGEVIIVRYADDFVVGFQHRDDALLFLGTLRERLELCRMALRPDKTRLIEFGRFAASNRKERGQGKTETFNFLGFTHICGVTRKGRFKLLRAIIAKRWRAKLKDFKEGLRRRARWKIEEVAEWLKRAAQGYCNCFAIHDNLDSLVALRHFLGKLWFKTINRRSQQRSMAWEIFIKRWRGEISMPRVLHPYPGERFDAQHPEKSPVR
jgi:hypothetical protein